MQAVKDFLRECGTFYVATVEDDQPRVRPFGVVSEFEGRLYISTNNTKPVSRQLKANAKFEICGMVGRDWIRLSGKAVLDDRREAREAMLEQNPNLSNMYSADDGKMEVYYITEATANILNFEGRHDTYNF